MNFKKSRMMSLRLAASFLFFTTVCGYTVAQDDAEQNPQELMQQAQAATQSQDFEKAVEILRKVEELVPNNPDVHFQLGYNLHASGNLDEAIVYHKKALVSPQFKPTALYNLACAYSIKDDRDQAFDYLKQSVVAGFRDLGVMENDPDMNNIKADPRFKEMVAMIKNGGKPVKKLTAEDFYGVWTIDSATKAGKKAPSSAAPISINEKSFVVPGGPDGDFVMSYKWDLDAQPITVDFTIESGPVKSGKAKGIMKFQDDKLLLCYHPEGETRPGIFISTAENGFFLFKLSKVELKTQTKGSHPELVKQFLGKWKCVKGLRAGEEIAPERMESEIIFDEKMITIPIGDGMAFKMSYTIDTNKSPFQIDMKIEEGPAEPGSKALGIIKMQDGRFFLCYDTQALNHPQDFVSTSENKFFLFEMTPIK